jgi:glycosyltransferase involved in cell wall biosynthesis
MRIAWCTPFGVRSSIGRVSRQVVERLRKSAEVDIWYPHTPEPLETSAPCNGKLTGGPADAARLAAYDLAVYSFGNHVGHSEIFEASRRTPGVAILHDIVMQGFFATCYLSKPERRDRYAAAMRRWYGAPGVRAARDIMGDRQDFLRSPGVLDFPLFEEAIAGSYAVVTHSRFAEERVRAVFPGVVRRLALPHVTTERSYGGSRKQSQIPDGRLLALTVGDVNPNKRVHVVLEALRSDPTLAARIYYVVIGSLPPDYGHELLQRVNDYGLEKTVRLAGHLPDEALASYLAQADFCVTLRHPTTEAASASAIEQLAYGKAAIVTASGFYRELPDECVLKVRPERELEDLREALSRLAHDSTLRRDLGRRAHAYAEKTFRADRYADGFLELAGEILDAKPLFAFTDRLGRELARMGLSPNESLVKTVADLAGGLFHGQ